MRSYEQHCGLAKALDVIGDRWTLLVARELLVWKRARFSDLRNGLPGIASNLLAQRLRDMEQTGIISRRSAAPPVATAVYELTARGEALRPILREIGLWGAPLLSRTGDDASAQLHWLALPIEFTLCDAAPDASSMTLEVSSDGEQLSIEVDKGLVRCVVGAAEHPDAVLSGPTRRVMQTLLHGESLTLARKHGVRYRGNPNVLARLRPRAKSILEKEKA